MQNSMLLKLAGAGLALALSATNVWAKADTTTQPIAEPAPILMAQADTTTDDATTVETPFHDGRRVGCRIGQRDGRRGR